MPETGQLALEDGGCHSAGRSWAQSNRHSMESRKAAGADLAESSRGMPVFRTGLNSFRRVSSGIASDKDPAEFGRRNMDGSAARDPIAASLRHEAVSVLTRLQRRDPAALAEVYDLFGGKAFGLAHRILGDTASAEDAVQDAFLHLWNQARRLDANKGRVDTYLMTIVHRRSIDLLRRRANRNAHHDLLPEDVIDERPIDVADEVAAKWDSESVHRALSTLGAEQREAIELAYFQGLTHREIAEKTGAPVGTVKSRLRLGVEKLRFAFGIGGER